MRADRLLSILLLLQTHGKLTTQQLAHKLEVSARTIQRDMEALGMAGLPIVSERGSQGAWSLVETYRAALFALTTGEIQSLFLSYSIQVFKDLGLSKAVEAALLKVEAFLPEMQRRDAKLTHQDIYIDISSWNGRDESVVHLPLLQEALRQECKVRMHYRRETRIVERVIDPLGLVAKGIIWYLIAAAQRSLRVFRVSRIVDAMLLEERRVRPADFDLKHYWDQWQADFRASLPRYDVMLRVPAQLLGSLAHSPFGLQVVNQAEGIALVRLQFEREAQATGYLFSYGLGVEIVEPPELLVSVRELARSILAQEREDLCDHE